jgi:hypothetical protein
MSDAQRCQMACPLVGRDDPSKPLRSTWLAVPAVGARYLAQVADIAKNDRDWHTLEVRVTRYQALIEADVETDRRKLYTSEAFDQPHWKGSSTRAAASCWTAEAVEGESDNGRMAA